VEEVKEVILEMETNNIRDSKDKELLGGYMELKKILLEESKGGNK
jgi:hypothetical protein